MKLTTDGQLAQIHFIQRSVKTLCYYYDTIRHTKNDEGIIQHIKKNAFEYIEKRIHNRQSIEDYKLIYDKSIWKDEKHSGKIAELLVKDNYGEYSSTHITLDKHFIDASQTTFKTYGDDIIVNVFKLQFE